MLYPSPLALYFAPTSSSAAQTAAQSVAHFGVEQALALYFVGVKRESQNVVSRLASLYSTARFDTPLVAPYELRVDSRLRADYSLRAEALVEALYGDAPFFTARIASTYGDAQVFATRLASTYGDAQAFATRLAGDYALLTHYGSRVSSGYDILTVERVASRLAAPWSIIGNAAVQPVFSLPEIIWRGKRIRVIRAELSCDEGSPVYLGKIEIADDADFAQMAIGDEITFALDAEQFRLVIDGKTMTRGALDARQLEITVISPLALHDAPFAATTNFAAPTATSARAIVESVIGQVEWRLPDWIVPAGALQVESATPLDIARRVATAIGGVIESAPDGTPIFRARHPVSIPDYPTATIDNEFFDHDVFSAQEVISPSKTFNRVTISNEPDATAGAEYRLEYAANDEDRYSGVVRAYAPSDKNLTLVHTGHPQTEITPLGRNTRTEEEIVEFIEGTATTKYPVAVIDSIEWQHSDLGAVTHDGQRLTAQNGGYSLAEIRYSVESLDFHVRLAVDEEVQFVLMEV